MLLAQSFGLFVKSTSARPYLDSKIDGFSNDKPVSQNMFGLGGIYVEDTGELRVTIGNTDSGVDFRVLDSGVLGIYRTTDTGSDYLAYEIELDPELLKKSKEYGYYWEIISKPQFPASEIMLGCSLVSGQNTYSMWNPAESEERSRHVNYYRERYRTTVDVLPERDIPEFVLVENEHVMRTIVDLNFRTDSPVISGSGNLSYNGGGNRYLFNSEGVAELQTPHQSPWSIPASMFIESESKNVLFDSGLHRGFWKYSSSSPMVVNQQFTGLESFPAHRAVTYSVSSPAAMDSYWEWESELAESTTRTHTASLFWQCTFRSDRYFRQRIGLRVYDTSSVLIRDVFVDIDPTRVEDLGMHYVSDFVSSPSSTPVKVSVYVRVQDMCPGDRFECVIALPQIETSGTASSRIDDGKTRLADNVNWIPDVPDYDDVCGRFDITVYPAYDGIPGGAGDQYLLDTRDSNGDSGFWFLHRWDGVLEFGIQGDGGYKTWILESSSVMQFSYGREFVLTLWFDTNTMRMDTNGIMSGIHVFNTVLEIPDTPLFRIGRRYDNTSYFNGEISRFSMSTQMLNAD